MANVPPGAPGAAGITTTPDAYPQWGVKNTTSGSSPAGTYSTVEAKTAAQKQSYLDQGYDTWFSSAADAKSFVSSENSALNGNIPTGNILGSIIGFSGTNFVLRAVKVIIGGVLLIIGLAHMTGADNAVFTLARKAPLPV